MSSITSSTHPAIIKAREQAKKSNKMSITQTFYLAHQARGKLSSEAAKSDHDLRFLVGHANLLDRLMLNLQTAEQEQDAWFNNMVSGNVEEEVEEKTRSWESIVEEAEPNWLAQDYSDSESESDDEEDYEMDEDFSLFPALTLSKKTETRSFIDTIVEEEEVDEYSDDDEVDDDGLYMLQRTTSNRPPSLVSDESDSEDEDSTPPSPPQPTLSAPVLSEKQRKQLVTTSYYDESSTSEQMLDEAFYLSSRSNMISAF